MAKRSIMFIGAPMNFSLRGLQVTLIKYSIVKKPMEKWSMIPMMLRRSGNSTIPCSSVCSSSMVETMKVTVEMSTMVKEKKAQNLSCSLSEKLRMSRTWQCYLSKGTPKCSKARFFVYPMHWVRIVHYIIIITIVLNIMITITPFNFLTAHFWNLKTICFTYSSYMFFSEKWKTHLHEDNDPREKRTYFQNLLHQPASSPSWLPRYRRPSRSGKSGECQDKTT